ncbi:hypothetical protein D3C71_2013970 [compost metagenome]
MHSGLLRSGDQPAYRMGAADSEENMESRSLSDNLSFVSKILPCCLDDRLVFCLVNPSQLSNVLG